MTEKTLKIPYNFEPRDYQRPVFEALERGIKRVISVWHRRAGKDKTFFNLMIRESIKRKGNYYYFFPTYSQGRKALWDGKDKDGFPFLGHIPAECIVKKNEAEMKINLSWGSMIQLIGSDNYDSVMGTNPVGCVFSEYALQDPKAWDFIRPILVENGGWALFNFTPRGRNHGWDLFQSALQDPSWFVHLLTIDDTKAISHADVQAEVKAGMPEELAQQEFWCSFNVGSEHCVIPLEWVLAARKRSVTPRGKKVGGLDVARFGADHTALVVRQDNAVVYADRWQGYDTVMSAGKVMDAFNAGLLDSLNVDVIGVGGGPADILRAADKFPVADVNVGEKAKDEEKYNRLRDELWFNARNWFAQPDVGFLVNGSLGQKMIAELTNPLYGYTPTQRKKVEDKAHMKDRTGASPDLADALCLTFFNPPTKAFPNGYF